MSAAPSPVASPLPLAANVIRWRPPVIRPRLQVVVGAEEAAAVVELGVSNLRRLKTSDPAEAGWRAIGRLLRPLDAVNAGLDSPPTPHRRRAMLDVVALLLTRCGEPGAGSYWEWDAEEWVGVLGRTQTEFRAAAPAWVGDEVRPYLAAHAFLLGGFNQFHRLGRFQRLVLCWRIFSRDLVSAEIGRLRMVLAGWGYQLGRADDPMLPLTVAALMLLNRSPHLEDLNTDLFDHVREQRLLGGARLNTVYAVQRAVAQLGFCAAPAGRTGTHAVRSTGGATAWQQWADRWHDTSTLTPRARGGTRSNLLKVGRWLAAEHPEAADPSAWTRQTCATWIGALDRMRVGDFVQRTAGITARMGKPLTAASKAGQIAALRTFFRDCQEWEWLPRRFDPQRALATPRSIAAALGPNPRVIADDVWAKLLWAGLNLTADDLPTSQAGPFYPLELVRAVTLTWLFSGRKHSGPRVGLTRG
ncbi:MAG TPA: hypothetical protein VFC19_38025 [Candidatus Limnocylindrales bacterium]|nr:hypothetical protein [Candidatus Limnocylindrales bacterium]